MCTREAFQSMKYCNFDGNIIIKRSKFFNVEDFRSISILPFLSKIFENLLKDQILDFINPSGHLTRMQSGFRAGYSTASALLRVTHDFKEALSKKMIVILLLLDFSKAFDSVDHDILCGKLVNKFRFSTSAASLISNYLTGRTQSVMIDGIMSDFLPVTKGVPQGSILGPVLFLMFINDLPNKLRFMTHHLFADDVQLYRAVPPPNNHMGLSEAIEEINQDMLNVGEWARTNKLVLNARKTKAMVISGINGMNSQAIPPVLMDGVPLVTKSLLVAQRELFNLGCLGGDLRRFLVMVLLIGMRSLSR